MVKIVRHRFDPDGCIFVNSKLLLFARRVNRRVRIDRCSSLYFFDSWSSPIGISLCESLTYFNPSFEAMRKAVLIAASGLREMESIPCSTSHSANPGKSDGACPQIPTGFLAI